MILILNEEPMKKIISIIYSEKWIAVQISQDPMNKTQSDIFFYQNDPIRLTESRRLKLNSEGWGFLTEYYLESVKIDDFKGRRTSSATLRISDRSGQVTCVVKGKSIGLLFGLSAKEWGEVENMCIHGQQLFYRYFKSGVSRTSSIEQRVFYNFCMTNQKTDVLIARFQRRVNMRNKFKTDTLLNISELRKCDMNMLDMYINHLRKFNGSKQMD